MPFLFSYGTLQQDAVQLSTFGRRLTGERDELPGFEQSSVPVNGGTYRSVRFTGSATTGVPGMLFEITDSEPAKADAYERDFDYRRILATLASAKQAWVYVHDEERPFAVVE